MALRGLGNNLIHAWAVPGAMSLALLLSASPLVPQAHAQADAPDVRLFFQAVSRDERAARAARAALGDRLERLVSYRRRNSRINRLNSSGLSKLIM